MTRPATILALLLCLIPAAAQAASGGATCTVSATGVAFGTFNPLGSAVTSTGTITVTCSGGSISGIYIIALSTGYGTLLQRTMKNGTNILAYNLYTNPALTAVWGDATGTSVTVSGTNGHTTKTYTVYGQVPGPQPTVVVPVSPSTYTDSITVTVTY